MPTSVQSVQMHCPTDPTGPPFASYVSANQRYIFDQYNHPWLMAGDAQWGMLGGASVSDMNTYLADRAAKGFNCILTCAVPDSYAGIAPGDAVAFDGTPAFTGTVTGGYQNMANPNPAFWTQVDNMLALCRSYGMSVLLLPLDAANTFGNSYTMSMAEVNGHAACVNFGTFLANRYKNTPGIIWCHGDDYTPGGDDAYVGGICDGINAAWPSNLRTVENTLNGAQQYSNAASTWTARINLDLLYPGGNGGNSYAIAQTGYASSPTYPAFCGEDNYELAGSFTPFTSRNQKYWTMVTGGCGHVYGILNYFGSGWQTRLNTTGQIEFGYWRNVWDQLAWWTLVPDTGNTFLTSGFSSGNSLALAAVDPAGHLGAAYAPVNGPMVINMTKMAGTSLARWWDPTANSFATIGSFANTGTQSFTSPAAHADGSRDYLLVLTA